MCVDYYFFFILLAVGEISLQQDDTIEQTSDVSWRTRKTLEQKEKTKYINHPENMMRTHQKFFISRTLFFSFVINDAGVTHLVVSPPKQTTLVIKARKIIS